MRQKVQWNLDGLEPEAREAAKEAARRAGMTLGEWLSQTIVDQSGRAPARAYPQRADNSFRNDPGGPVAETLEQVAQRLTRLQRDRQTQTALREPEPVYPDVEAIVSAAAAESERRMRDSSLKTAQALDSVARWMERADERWTEAARQSEDRQERASTVFGQAFNLMTRRLDEIEQRMGEGSQPALKPVWTAMERIEGEIRKLAKTQADPPQLARLEQTLMGFEGRLADIATRLAETPARRPLRRDMLGDAVAEIRQRQDEIGEVDIDHDLPVAPPLARRRGETRGPDLRSMVQDQILRGLKTDMAQINARLDTLREPSPASRELQDEVARLHEAMGRVASRDTVDALESAVRDLGQRLLDGRLGGLTDSILDPIQRLQADVRRLSTMLGADGENELAREVRAIARSIETLEDGADPRHVDQIGRELAAEIAQLRSLVADGAQEEKLRELTREVARVSVAVGQIGSRQIDANDFDALKSAVEDIRSGLKSRPARAGSAPSEPGAVEMVAAIRDELGALSGRIDLLAEETRAARAPANIDAALTSRLDSLAAKLDESLSRPVTVATDDLAMRIDQLSEKLEVLPVPGHAGHEDITKRLDSLARKLDARPESQGDDLSVRIDQLLARLDSREPETEGDFAARLAELTERLDRRQEPVSPALADRIEMLAARIETRDRSAEDLATRIDMLAARVEASLAQPQQAADPKLQHLLSTLVKRMEEAQRPGASTSALDALEQQVATLSRQLDDPAPSRQLAPLEKAMSDLAARIDHLGHETREAARRAVAEALEGRAIDASPAHGEPIVRHLGELRAAQAEAEQRTRNTLNSVHGTLDKLLDRLAQMEREISRPPAPAVAAVAPALTPRAPQVDREMEREAPLSSAATQASVQTALTALVGSSRVAPPPVAPPLTPAPAPTPAPARSEAVAPNAAVAQDAPRAPGRPDVPLEPGSGRPAARNQAPASRDNADAQDVKASFIAAARRAAQAAAAEAASEPARKPGLMGRVAGLTSRRPDPAAEGKARNARASAQAGPERTEPELASAATVDTALSSAGDPADLRAGEGARPGVQSVVSKPLGLKGLLHTLNARRKPLLLGMAALVLTWGAIQLGSNLLREDPVQSVPEGAPAATPSTPPAGNVQGLLPPAGSRAYERGLALLQGPDSTASLPPQEARRALDMQSLLPKAAPGGVKLDSQSQDARLQETRLQDGRSIPLDPAAVGRITPAPDQPAREPVAAPLPAPTAPLQPAATAAEQAPSASSPVRIAGMSDIGELPANAGTAGLRRAALAGEPGAVLELAARLAEGRGAPRDPRLAARILEKAAAAGLAPAQYRLGSLYEKGSGLPRDAGLARQWYERAAQKGNAKAMHNLAVLLAEGAATGRPDYAGAVLWFTQASEYGVRDSQFNLGVLLARGLGAEQNLVEAWRWFAIAARQGDEDAGRKRDEVGQKLSPTDLAAAQVRLGAYQPKPLDKAANEMLVAPALEIPTGSAKPIKSPRS
jgi:localization factor PodJL